MYLYLILHIFSICFRVRIQQKCRISDNICIYVDKSSDIKPFKTYFDDRLIITI
jgi:hypothetical protein